MHPTPEALRHAYAHRPFSVFAVNRQVKLAGERVSYDTIHSALIFAVSGRASLTLGDETLVGERGRVLHGCPHRPLVFESLGDEPFVHINIYYQASPDTAGDPDDWLERPWTFAPECYDELLGRTPSLETRLNQMLGATSLIRSLADPSPRRRVSERMARAYAHLDSHYADPITLADLAEYCDMSEQRFSYCFWRAYGIRPMNFLIARRLERACELLRAGMAVKDVARTVGYADPLYFSRLFKRHYGWPPSAVRGGW